MFRVITVLGARPQFIKSAPLSKAFLYEEKIKEIIIHTGQHYDYEMSEIFFEELKLPKPDYYLSVGSHSHGKQTGLMLKSIEDVLIKEKPDMVLVYGDTNSTLAGALAAAKLNISVAHIEAGLRSYNRKMPEEINRVLTDRLSSLLFCPTLNSVENLKKEGIKDGVFHVGDVMYDALLMFIDIAESRSKILEKQNLKSKEYVLATIHRAENTDDPKRLKKIMEIFSYLPFKVVFPIHPRTKKEIKRSSILIANNIKIIPPVSYLDMILLEKNSILIITDSGGVQKEAYLLKVPCITLRGETEWVETVEIGANRVIGLDEKKLGEAINHFENFKWQNNINPFGDGKSSEKIVKIIKEFISV
ncbi:MAG: UDP-N-acetylglucosamine 2-epimerase (non-hydrolyzing) [Deltaproteobacteria bacterium]|nr:UDP-N-acetylglucosamine 2-epimerase (non-hydrolyzing) [Deltaproteobacteria bacterium]